MFALSVKSTEQPAALTIVRSRSTLPLPSPAGSGAGTGIMPAYRQAKKAFTKSAPGG